MSRFRSASATSAILAIALAAIAFAAGSGTTPDRAAPTEVAVLVVAGAILIAAILVDTDSRPVYGGWALGFFALLVVVTGLSMEWSVAPDLSLQEMGRSLTYLAAFAAAIVGARHAPGAGRHVLVSVTLTALAVCIWALMTRVFPGALAEQVLGARLGAPFDYWNALGGMAAVSVPGLLWLAARREGPRATAVLAYPGLGVAVITILLTQSRGALAAAVLGALVWIAAVPLRLRTAPILAIAPLAVAPVSVWALSQDAFTKTLQPLSVRADVAGRFALFLLLTLIVTAGAGYGVVRGRDLVEFGPERRRRAGIALTALLSALVLAGLVGAATTGGGLAGRVDSLTAENSTVAGAGGGRLGSTSSSRGEYWRQAVDVFEERPLLGRGADGFGLARLPYRKDPQPASHAHGFLAQTAADLGLLGLVITAGLFAAWLIAAARTLQVRLGRAAPSSEWTSDRIALTALAIAVLAYGFQSTIDWTWYIPGVTVVAIVAAGFVAGRGPLGSEPPARRWPKRGSLRIVGAAATTVTVLLCAWSVWQPKRSSDATDEVISLTDAGNAAAAVREADEARDIDPYSPEPLYAKALALEAAGRDVDAYRALETAVAEHPRDPDAWIRLGTYELDQLNLPVRALASANAAYSIDRQSMRVAVLAQGARMRIAADQAALAPQPERSP